MSNAGSASQSFVTGRSTWSVHTGITTVTLHSGWAGSTGETGAARATGLAGVTLQWVMGCFTQIYICVSLLFCTSRYWRKNHNFQCMRSETCLIFAESTGKNSHSRWKDVCDVSQSWNSFTNKIPILRQQTQSSKLTFSPFSPGRPMAGSPVSPLSPFGPGKPAEPGGPNWPGTPGRPWMSRKQCENHIIFFYKR